MVKLFVRALPDSEEMFHLDRDFKKRLTRVMRLRQGDQIEVITPENRWECELHRILPDGVQLRIVRSLPALPAPHLSISLAQAIPKGDRFDWLIQKATELGIREIIPLITKHSVVRPANVDAKLQRWNEIAEHAAGQSENSYPALVHAPNTLTDFLRRQQPEMKLLLHERAGAQTLRETISAQHSDKVALAVGPEGGWGPEEADQLTNAGFIPVHIGPRIFRSETAGIVVAAILQYELGDLGR